MHIMIKKSVADEICRYWGFPLVRKSNPNHDTQGRFAAGHKGERKLGHAAYLRAVFKDATDLYVGKEITNKATGIKAVFSKESQKEISGNTGLSKSNGFGIAKHFEVANQVIELFENATLVNRHEDAKHGDKNVSVERFLSQPVTLKSGEAVQACITVKHTRSPDGRNLYSLEAMSVENALEKTRAKGQHPASSEASPLSPAPSISKDLEKTSDKSLRSPRLMLRKSAANQICRFWGFPLVKAYNPRDPKFEYFKRKIIAHLEKLERQEARQVSKSLVYFERLEKARHATYNIGETATWNGKKYIKGPDKKWRRYYEGHSKQAETTITRLKGRARKCQNSAELWDLVFNNWGRFMDTDGMPLPLVREFHQYVSTIEDEINAGVAVENRTAHRAKRKRSPSGAKRKTEEPKRNARDNPLNRGGGEPPDKRNGAALAGEDDEGKRKIAPKKWDNAKIEEIEQLEEAFKNNGSMTVKRKGLGDIVVNVGKEGRHGFGLKHIISERLVKDGKNVDEITALIPLVLDAAKYGEPRKYRDEKQTSQNNYCFELDGIRAVVTKDYNNTGEKWVLSGYEIFKEGKATTDPVNAVLTKYRYASEFSALRKQVGAAVASFDENIANRANLSSEKIAKAKKTIADEKQRQAKEDATIKKLKEKFKEWKDGFVEEYFINGYVYAGKYRDPSADARNLFDIEGKPVFEYYVKQVGRPTAKGNRLVYSDNMVNVLKPDGTLLRDEWIGAGEVKFITNNVNTVLQEDGTYQLCNDDWEPISPEKYGRVRDIKIWKKKPFSILFEYKNDERHYNLEGCYFPRRGDKYKLIDKDGNVLPYTFVSKLADDGGPYTGNYKARVFHKAQLQVTRDDGKQNLIGPEGLLLKEFYDYVDNCPIAFSPDASEPKEFYNNAYTVVGRKNSKGEYEYNLAWLETGEVVGDWLTADKYDNDVSSKNSVPQEAQWSRVKYILLDRAEEIMKQRYNTTQKSLRPRLMVRKSVARAILRQE